MVAWSEDSEGDVTEVCKRLPKDFFILFVLVAVALRHGSASAPDTAAPTDDDMATAGCAS